MKKGTGHNVKSLEEKKAAGTFRKDRHANVMEGFIPPTDQTPPPPIHFTDAHVKEWFFIWDLLREANALSRVDYPAMVMYVENWVMKDQAWMEIEAFGITIDGKKNPACTVYSDCVTMLRQLIEQFGGTLRARQGLKIEKPKTQSALIAQLSGTKTKAV